MYALRIRGTTCSVYSIEIAWGHDLISGLGVRKVRLQPFLAASNRCTARQFLPVWVACSKPQGCDSTGVEAQVYPENPTL